MKRVFVALTVILTASIVLTSCFKDEDAEKRDQEKKQIEEYVKSHGLNPVITNSGLNYIERVKGTGDSLKSNSDYAFITYRATYLNGQLFDATDTSLFKNLATGSLPWQKIGGVFKLSMWSNFYGLVEGLSRMREGGKATLIMPSLISYNDYTPRIYEIDSFKVVHDIVAYEKTSFQDSIRARNRNLSDSTLRGSYVFLYQDTAGIPKPATGDSVKVKFTSYILDGRVFQKSTSFKYKVGYNSNYNLPSGVDEAIRMLGVNRKCRVYIPFYRFFGGNTGYDMNTGQIILPAFSNVKYDIERLE